MYEVLREHLGEEGARLVAERIPAETVRPEDLDRAVNRLETAIHTLDRELRTEMGTLGHELRSEMGSLSHQHQQDMSQLRIEMAEFKADTRGWMLSYFVPLWIGVYGTIAAVIITHILD